jgi:hypothetical protein
MLEALLGVLLVAESWLAAVLLTRAPSPVALVTTLDLLGLHRLASFSRWATTPRLKVMLCAVACELSGTWEVLVPVLVDILF